MIRFLLALLLWAVLDWTLGRTAILWVAAALVLQVAWTESAPLRRRWT